MPERREVEQRLFREYRRNGDPEALVERFLPLARSLARRAARGAEPLDDLDQVASLALLKAVYGFDLDRGTAFGPYAVPSTAGALKRHYRDSGWAVRPSRAPRARPGHEPVSLSKYRRGIELLIPQPLGGS